MKTNVMRHLERRGVAYVRKPHSQPVFTSEDAARERGVRVSQIVKTMLVIHPDHGVAAVLLPGDRRLDLRKVAAALGVKKVALLERDRVRATTGYEPGAVSPISMQSVRTFLLDPAILDEEYVDISSGRPDEGVELRSADLAALINPAVIQVSRDE
jgi:Cys-tRNA(Pro) deacylase